MNWFFIALITPFLHAIANHIDKHLISRYFKSGGVGALVIFTSIFALLAMPVIYFINPNVIHIGLKASIALLLNGTLSLVYVIFYLHALEDDEATIVAPFFQTIPIFGFIFGYLLLGETLTNHQIFASILIIAGSFLLSLDLSNGIKIKKKLVSLMLASSSLYALNGVIFKSIAINSGFIESLFWGMTGQVVLGLVLYLFVKSYRTQLVSVMRENSRAVLGLNFLNGIIILAGDIVVAYALLLAPVTLILAVGGFQPLFVFIFGVLLTLFFPKFGRESLVKRDLVQKIAGILIIVAGSLFIS
jgi:uncharacterized membrane protein